MANQKPSFGITATEETIAKYGSGLYLRLKFEMATEGCDYERLYKLIQSKSFSDRRSAERSLKAYNRLIKRVKKITGYQFNIYPVDTIEQRSEWQPAKKETNMIWVTDFKLPPGLQKLNGDKFLTRKEGNYQYILDSV